MSKREYIKLKIPNSLMKTPFIWAKVIHYIFSSYYRFLICLVAVQMHIDQRAFYTYYFMFLDKLVALVAFIF